MNKICLNCGKEFRSYPSEIHKKFCGKTCQRAYTRIVTNCPVCGKEIICSPSTAGHKVYCSKECRNSVNYMNLTCEICGKEYLLQKCFKDVKMLKRRCCSEECKKKYIEDSKVNKVYICAQCGKEFSAYRSPKSHTKFCSQECSKKFMRGENHHSYITGTTITVGGYKAIKVGNKYLLEHRLVMEDHLGRKLKSSEEIHHIDGDKLNNNVNNLIIMSKEEHARYHNEQKRFKNACHGI